MLQDYFVLAFKNLRHRGVRSWLTLLGIFIGVAAVISLILLGNGLKMAVAGQFGVSSTEIISVQASGINYGPPGSGDVIPLTVDDMEAIRKLSSVKRVLRKNIVSGKLEYNDKVVFGYATNVPDGDDREFIYDILELEAEFGRLLKDSDSKRVILGNNFYADKVGLDKPVKPGDKVLINDRKFEVIGITKKTGSFMRDNIILMNEKELEDLMGYGDEVDVIAVQPKSKDLVDKTKKDIENLLRARRNVKLGEENFQVSTPEAMMETVNNILGGVQAFIVIVALISIFIGAIGIVNTMTTSVLERKREIGIMKSIGARNSQIFMQFFVESSLLGLTGGIVGIILGMIIGFVGVAGLNNFLGSTIKLNVSFALIFFSLLGSFLIGGLSGIWPAMNASKQNPVEAIRGWKLN